MPHGTNKGICFKLNAQDAHVQLRNLYIVKVFHIVQHLKTKKILYYIFCSLYAPNETSSSDRLFCLTKERPKFSLATTLFALEAISTANANHFIHYQFSGVVLYISGTSRPCEFVELHSFNFTTMVVELWLASCQREGLVGMQPHRLLFTLDWLRIMPGSCKSAASSQPMSFNTSLYYISSIRSNIVLLRHYMYSSSLLHRLIINSPYNSI